MTLQEPGLTITNIPRETVDHQQPKVYLVFFFVGDLGGPETVDKLSQDNRSKNCRVDIMYLN